MTFARIEKPNYSIFGSPLATLFPMHARSSPELVSVNLSRILLPPSILHYITYGSSQTLERFLGWAHSKRRRFEFAAKQENGKKGKGTDKMTCIGYIFLSLSDPSIYS